MPTGTTHHPANAAKFILWGVAGSLALFGGLRLPWMEAHFVLPLTRIQGDVAVALFGSPRLPVQVTLACSGADAFAVCVGAVLAYPVRWRARVAGAVGGIALILALNTFRIGTLGLVVASPPWFNALHLYGWPALMMLTIAGYVFLWMRIAERREPACEPIRSTSPPATRPRAWQPSRRFVTLTAVFVIAFAAASPIYLDSPQVLALGGVIAAAAAALLSGAGADAYASANVLATSRGSFVVTQECVSTPLIPVYLAAVCAYAPSWRRMAAGAVMMVPIFTALGVVRLLVVALPSAVMASPTFLVHAFYQLVLAAVVVFLAARWRHGTAAPAYAAAGVTAGVLFVLLIGPAYTWMVTPRLALSVVDPQGALAFLPAFQVGLYLALWVATFVDTRWTRVTAGLAGLALTQVAGLLALHALTVAGFVAQVRDIRAWAVAGPILFFAWVVTRAGPAR